MTHKSVEELVIPASMLDMDVPSEEVKTVSSLNRIKRREGLFLKGPIPFTWVRQNIASPMDRLLLVIRAYRDMQQSPEVKITKRLCRDAGVDGRKVVYRAIANLERSGSLSVVRKPGCKAIVKMRR